MPPREIKTVYQPHDEPYLGNEHLRSFDLAIPAALAANGAVARRTFGLQMSPLQQAASEIIPQGISISLSVRELIRQAYLYSAGILVRPLIERTAMVCWLRDHPAHVSAWHNGWSRKKQPTMNQLLTHLHPNYDEELRGQFRVMLHKLLHADPASAVFNLIEHYDGKPAFSSGRIYDEQTVCSFLSVMGERYLKRLAAVATEIFPDCGAAV